ncbi:MAG TPA: hypothetical protein VKU00_10300, partial [Chthonomonadaceae bacterium]|nr:hypothetical protein [Chthonomonadaceae bacterium]
MPLAQGATSTPIDYSHWVSDSVTLYYFDDIPRLMQVLSPNTRTVGGQTGLKEDAEAKQTALLQATQDLATKRQAVNDARTELATKRAMLENAVKVDTDALNKANAKAGMTSTNVLKLTEQQTLAQNDVDKAQSDVDQAQKDDDQAKMDLAADMNNKDKIATLSKADSTLKTYKTTLTKSKDRLATINAKLATAKAEDNTAQADKTDAKAKLDADQNEQTGLAAKVKQAEDALKTASSDVNGAMTASILAAEAANLAFAHARDNAPFLASYPDPNAGQHDDPVHRVLLTGFSDSKAIFIRGNQEDVDRVRELIMKFDRPQAQAVMTLWTLEVSSDGTAKGAQRTTEALKIIEQELTVARVQSDAALSLLRDCINTAVKQALADYA